jgi:hypothetical protein
MVRGLVLWILLLPTFTYRIKSFRATARHSPE